MGVIANTRTATIHTMLMSMRSSHSLIAVFLSLLGAKSVGRLGQNNTKR